MDSIYRVVTVKEARHMWGKHQNTIMFAVWREQIAARKSGGTWIISFDDCVKLWGNPQKGFLNNE